MAIALILGFVAYAITATLISKGDWEKPYGRLPFLVLLGLLALSTASCATERTKRAMRVTRSFGRISDKERKRLADSSKHRISIGDISVDDAMTAVAEGLRGQGLKVSAGKDTLEAASGLAFIWGSPVFHWALVALVVVVGLGRLTRSEGYLGIPVGQSVADVHGSYLSVEDGRLFGERHTGLRLEVSRVDRSFADKGVLYGITPLVNVYRGDRLVARQWVHPNRPLRVGAVMIHMKELGPALVLSANEQGIGQTGLTTLLLKRAQSTASGTVPQETTISRMSGGEPVRIVAQVVVRKPGESRSTPSRAMIETTTADGHLGHAVTVVKGSSVQVVPGLDVRVVDVKDWVRLSVVNDWSVPVLYALFLIAILGLAAAVVPSTRRVSLLLVPEGGRNTRIHVVTWQSRRGVLFEEQVLEMMYQAADGKECR